MELVEGNSLQLELDSGRRFDWRETTQFSVAVCQALKHAHDCGVIHRDLKPANLLLAEDNQIKLSESLVVSGHFSFTLKYPDGDRILIVIGGGEGLAFLSGDCGVTVDQTSEHTP